VDVNSRFWPPRVSDPFGNSHYLGKLPLRAVAACWPGFCDSPLTESTDEKPYAVTLLCARRF